ncbi:MAG: MFS transporter [Thermodesulfobacteriota bacterium]
MISKAKAIFYLIEFINSYTAVYYSNFLFFYLKRDFGFGAVENLLTAALSGGLYIFAAWQCGKYAERRGCIRALYWGLAVMVLSLPAGLAFQKSFLQVLVFCVWTIGICFTWPALEALISEKAGRRLADCVGLYNVTWAAGGAVGYFTAGLLLEGLGMSSLYWLPVLLIGLQMILLGCGSALRLKEEAKENEEWNPNTPDSKGEKSRLFLRLAWFANPFSYVAINTVIPLIPSIAEKLSLTTGQAGIVCSLWMFARLSAFAVLWRWTGWHYRFRWLAGAFLVMTVAFFGFLTAQTIWILVLAELCFGSAIGLIYYSSLYYSMNVSREQSTNAGIHEAVIGVGLFGGPVIGAVALSLLPEVASMGAWSVGGLLGTGFIGLFFVKRKPVKEKTFLKG